MISIETNINRGYLVSFVEIYIFLFRLIAFNKDHQRVDDDEYDYEYVKEQKN
jgi:hypothetical protein